ncbi:hypothetical protein GCM10022409_11530 [Hymenobacter glaciei]|uniref:Heparinase II/III-like C-terminal domain-containing protein n=1 Tax=Hymenobacter glaciei TaxID=877209 RepID=A0ABP7TPG7_9BACT
MRIFFLSLTLCLLLPGARVVAQAPQPGPVLANMPIPAHPRLLLLKGEEELIRQHLEQQLPLRSTHQAILAECDKLITEPCLQRVLTGRRLLSVARECLRREFYLSYAWRITGQAKYRVRAEQELLAVAAFSDWNPSHFLDVAELTMGVALGYDWLYAELPEASRRIIRNALVQKGLQPSFDAKHNDWLQKSNNWNQVCNAGMVFGALAIYEDQPTLASAVLNRAIHTVPLAMQAYAPDGAYPEGYGYWAYGTSYNVLLINALEKCFGRDFGLATQPGFLKTADYFLHMAGPSGQPFNYSDCEPTSTLQPAMYWFAARLHRPELLWHEQAWLRAASPSQFAHNPLLPTLLLWSSSLSGAAVKPPGATTWVGRGPNPVALLRTSWTAPGAIFLGLKAGSPSVNHGHMDVGSFVFEADGVRWGLDLGVQSYESLESKGVQIWGAQRWSVFRYSTPAHSTLVLNNQPQAVQGYAPLISYSDQPGFLSAIADLRQLYPPLRVAQRGVAIVDQRYAIVRDELATTAAAATVRWAMLTAATVKLRSAQEAELRQDGKTLRLIVQAPATITLKTWSTAPPAAYDAPNPGTTLVGFEVVLPPATRSGLTVLLLPGSAGAPPTGPLPTLAEWPRRAVGATRR